MSNRLKEIMSTKKITLDKLAELTGLSKGFLSNLSNNKVDVSGHNLVKLAQVLDVSIDYILCLDHKEKKQPTINITIDADVAYTLLHIASAGLTVQRILTPAELDGRLRIAMNKIEMALHDIAPDVPIPFVNRRP